MKDLSLILSKDFNFQFNNNYQQFSGEVFINGIYGTYDYIILRNKKSLKVSEIHDVKSVVFLLRVSEANEVPIISHI